MWTDQVNLGCVPYYMFMVRDTGAQHYFAVPLLKSCMYSKRHTRRSADGKNAVQHVNHLPATDRHGILDVNGQFFSIVVGYF